MAIVAPSILSANFANLEQDIRSIEASGAHWIHVDVMDGLFVPNISFGFPVLKAVRALTDMPLDVHLMITRPGRYIEAFARAGADRITVHVEADTQENILAVLDQIHALGCKSGISLKPGTPADAVIPFLGKCDLILTMLVEPGFGGQKLMPDMLPKLRRIHSLLKEADPNALVQVDGGIDTGTAPISTAHGAEVLVTGNAFFRSADRAAYVKQLMA